MGAKCKACDHPERAQLDAALVRGEPHRAIASRHGLSKASISRHARHAATVGPVRREASEARERSILERVRAIAEEARRSFEASVRLARVKDEHGNESILPTLNAADALREMGRMLDLEAKLTGAFAPKKLDVVVAGDQGHDLSRLSLEEIAQLRAIQLKLSGAAPALTAEEHDHGERDAGPGEDQGEAGTDVDHRA